MPAAIQGETISKKQQKIQLNSTKIEFAFQGAGRIMGALWNPQADKVLCRITKSRHCCVNNDDHQDHDNDNVTGGGDDLQGGDRVGDDPQL